jgi:hypothetical protein
MKAPVAIVLGTLLVLSPMAFGDPWSERDTRLNFDRFGTIILVKVTSSTFPKTLTEAAYSARATSRLIKSWKGRRFAVGETVHLIPPGACEGPPLRPGALDTCKPYLVHKGEELIIFASDLEEKVVVTQYTTAPAADCKATVFVLDQLAQEQEETPPQVSYFN